MVAAHMFDDLHPVHYRHLHVHEDHIEVAGKRRIEVSLDGHETWTDTINVAAGEAGRVEVRLEGEDGADWTVRDVAPPGVQKVTASRLLILDKGHTARGEKVVIYASMGQVLKDTITALIAYPFG